MTWPESFRALRDLGFREYQCYARSGQVLSRDLVAPTLARAEFEEDRMIAAGEPQADVWRLVAGSELHDGLGLYVRGTSR